MTTTLTDFVCEQLQIVNERNINVLRNRAVVGLTTIDKDKAASAVLANSKDAFKEVEHSKVKIKISDILPSQRQIVVTKVLAILFNDLLQLDTLPEELPLIISADNYLIDGHHRWAALFIANPEHELTVIKINLDRDHLISALNVITAGHLNKVGNPAKGNINNLNSKFVQKLVDNILAGNSSKVSVETAMSVMHKFDIQNVDRIHTEIPSTSLLRQDMPVIDADDVDDVLNLLTSGKIDFAEAVF